jgi:hypothetical protein
MRRTILLTALTLASCGNPPVAPLPLETSDETQDVEREDAPEPHRISFLAGARSLGDEEIWDPVAEELTLGVQYSTVGRSGFGIEFGLIGSTGFKDEVSANVDVTGAVLEGFVGLRKEFDWGKWRPAFGAGAALIAAGIDNDAGGGVLDDQDTSKGYYAHGGLFYDYDSSAFIGVDVRVLTGTELVFDATDADADYQQITLVLGLRF